VTRVHEINAPCALFLRTPQVLATFFFYKSPSGLSTSFPFPPPLRRATQVYFRLIFKNPIPDRMTGPFLLHSNPSRDPLPSFGKEPSHVVLVILSITFFFSPMRTDFLNTLKREVSLRLVEKWLALQFFLNLVNPSDVPLLSPVMELCFGDCSRAALLSCGLPPPIARIPFQSTANPLW